MKHYTPEEWLLFMDGEASPEIAKTLSEHLEACPQCASELRGWKRSAERLRRLTFPAQRRTHTFQMPMWKLALAATVVLLLGVVLGRFSQPNVDDLKSVVTAQLRMELRREMHNDVVAATRDIVQQRASDQKKVVALISGIRDRNKADCLALRQDLETAVSEADTGLRVNSRRIRELADVVSTTQQ